MEGTKVGAAEADELPTSTKQGMLVTFEGVGCSLRRRDKKEDFHVLQDVTGYFAPGTMTATMGPSGAGKTTFLDIVTGRKTKGNISGSLLYNGQQATQRLLKDHTAYVEQFDNLLPVLTVREMLMYQAELKCRGDESFASKRRRVDKLVEDLGLEGAKDVKIGDKAKNGISGGQAKRVNIGIALVTEPRIIFLDEPTTGLDSATSLDICSLLKGLAASGVTIMTTIHSPTTEAFRLFDNLLLLVRGRVCYFGKLHGPDGVADYLSTFQIVYDPLENLADFIIRETGDKVEAVDFAGAWQESQGSVSTTESCKQMLAELQRRGDASMLQTARSRRSNSIRAVGVLLRYRTWAHLKDEEFMTPRLAGNIIISLMMGSLYSGVGEKASNFRDTASRNNIAAVFFMTTLLSLSAGFDYMPSIVQERPLFYRESADGCYTTIAYVIFKLTEEVIPQAISSLIFCVVVHFLVQLQGNFFWLWLLYIVLCQAGLAMSQCCAALARNFDEASTYISIYIVVSIFFTGLVITYDALPVGWQWFSWTNFSRYAWSGMIANEFGEECEVVQELDMGLVTLDSYQTFMDSPSCPIEYFGLEGGSAGVKVYQNFLALAGLWLVWVILTWLIMANVRHVQR